VDRIQECLVGSAKLLRLEAEDAIHLIRPREPVLDEIELPTPEMSDLLRQREAFLARAQCGLGFAAFSDVAGKRQHGLDLGAAELGHQLYVVPVPLDAAAVKAQRLA